MMRASVVRPGTSTENRPGVYRKRVVRYANVCRVAPSLRCRQVTPETTWRCSPYLPAATRVHKCTERGLGSF
jgi:hypothetical protein